jgi:hypothetical protein
MEGQNRILGPEFVLIFGTIGMLLLVTAIILFVYLYQRKLIKRKLAFQEVEDLLKKQELATTYALLDGQDRERIRIAQELHDNISSTLVTLAMFLDSFEPKTLPDKDRILFEKIHHVAAKVSEDVRVLSHSLDSGSLKHFGLSVACQDLVEAISSSTSLKVTFTDKLITRLSADTSLNLYRIIQELFNNTLKHARATQIGLEITEIKDEYVNIIYEDNGIGFDPEKEKKGMGLKNIASRVENLDGQLMMDFKHKQKTTFIIEIPLR